MNGPDDITELRALTPARGFRWMRPIWLKRETPERIGQVFAELPQSLAEHIRAHLPKELQLQVAEPIGTLEAKTVGEIHGARAGGAAADGHGAGRGDRFSAQPRDAAPGSPTSTSPMRRTISSGWW